MLVLPTSQTISTITATMAPAPMVSPNSWKLFKMLVKPTFSMICLWGVRENVGFTISDNVAPAPEVSPNLWKLLARSDSPTLFTCAHEICVCKMGR